MPRIGVFSCWEDKFLPVSIVQTADELPFSAVAASQALQSDQPTKA
jgi:hypothetical protein